MPVTFERLHHEAQLVGRKRLREEDGRALGHFTRFQKAALPGRHDHHALDVVSQLAHVARPILRLQNGDRVVSEMPLRLSRLNGVELGEMLDEFGDILPTFGESRHAHGHDRNPAFKNVILHVVWEAAQGANGAPDTVTLSKILDAPLSELNLWLEREPAKSLDSAARRALGNRPS